MASALKSNSTFKGTFSAPGRPRALSSLHPQVKIDPSEANATVCIPPHSIFTICRAGNAGRISKSAGFRGFLISDG